MVCQPVIILLDQSMSHEGNKQVLQPGFRCDWKRKPATKGWRPHWKSFRQNITSLKREQTKEQKLRKNVSGFGKSLVEHSEGVLLVRS